MALLEQMQEIAEGAVEAYVARIDAVSSLIAESYEEMDRVRNEWEAIRVKLQEALASKASLRRHDFERMMGEALARQEKREHVIKISLQEALREQKGFAEVLKLAIASSDLNKIRTIQRDIGASIDRIKHQIDAFHREHRLLTMKLKTFVQQDDAALSVAEFKRVLKDVQQELEGSLPKAMVA